MRFVIEYGVNHEELALALARRLFAEFDEAIDTLSLLPIEDQSLALTLDGERVYPAGLAADPPTLGAIIGHLRQHGPLASLLT